MSIGPLVPGTPTTVTKDAVARYLLNAQGPAVDGLIVADDVLSVLDICLALQIGFGTVASMKAITAGDTGGKYLAFPQGLYYYDAGVTLASDNAPWGYQATGIGAGAWLKDDWGTWLHQITETRIKGELLNRYGKLTTSNLISFTINSATYVQLTDSATNQLNTSITGFSLGDELDITVGPFYVQAQPTDSVQVRVTLKQGATANTYVENVDNYSATIAASGHVVFPNLRFTVPAGGGVDVKVEVQNSGTTAPATIYTPGTGHGPAYGPSGVYQWAAWQHLRP